ncbi:hypothetical protein [Fangia hongkongensis]|uniref:hypothetical protein n=1 Tax=Fangia hongkongensis TaxID=270495 RepID=UPI0003627A53|nr:hypothetical protein [Fangia hongkongensis]
MEKGKKNAFELKLPVKIRDHKDNVIIIHIAYTSEGLEFSYLEMSTVYPEEKNILVAPEKFLKAI